VRNLNGQAHRALQASEGHRGVRQVLVPIAKKIPGLRSYDVSQGPIATPAGPSDLHLVATLHFDDMAAIGAAFASPEGKAAAADVAKFATGGVDMLFFDDADV
jgi:uncharacterized protein (TIGR02118 family)